VDNHDQPSQTALTAAAARAAHLQVDGSPKIFTDSLAAVLLSDRADELLAYHRTHGGHPVLSGARSQVVIRSRYAEDRLAESVQAGMEQYVILGAGLDSFAYRSALTARVRVFEVDHPGTQAWKRWALSRAGLAPLHSATFVAVDLSTDPLVDHLVAAGFDLARPAMVSWLGVTMYLTRAAIAQTLAAVGGLAPGTELVADYMLPAGMRDAAGDSYVEQVAPVAAQRGEPWHTLLAPDDMISLLASHGLQSLAQVHQQDAIDPALWVRSDGLRPVTLSVLAHAKVGEPVSATGRKG
jgi:methyltransferase (TIGR00027 family)